LRLEYFKHLADLSNISKEHKQFLKTVSQTLKVCLNSAYGVLGFSEFNLYFLPAAEAITALGRYSISKSIEKAKLLGIPVIASDTDSMFLESPTSDQMKEIQDWASKTVGVAMDVDKEYRYVCFSNRKKNYFGVLKDGSVDIKGLTGKKSNTPIFIRNTFKQVIEILKGVQTPPDFALAKTKIIELLRTKVDDLKSNKIPMEGLAFRVMLNKDLLSYAKDPQHVKAAQKLMLRTGKIPKAGEVIEFVKTLNGVEPLSLATRAEVDIPKYLEQMESTFDQILTTMGSDFKEVQGQTKLSDFWAGMQSK
jgi:DNA polymerase I